MKLPKIDLPAAVLLACLCANLVRETQATNIAMGLATLLFLGCRLIAYRQAEDVSALVARVTKAEEEAKRALTIATAQGRAKAQGF